MPVEALKLGKEISIGKITIQYSYRVMFIKGCQQVIAGILYGFQVLGSYITSCADENKIFYALVYHSIIVISFFSSELPQRSMLPHPSSFNYFYQLAFLPPLKGRWTTPPFIIQKIISLLFFLP
jgi:hypothetical protein